VQYECVSWTETDFAVSEMYFRMLLKTRARNHDCDPACDVIYLTGRSVARFYSIITHNTVTAVSQNSNDNDSIVSLVLFYCHHTDVKCLYYGAVRRELSDGISQNTSFDI
jgi:hypothetical protein